MGAARHFLKHPIDPAHMEVHMPVQAGAEPVDVDLGFWYAFTPISKFFQSFANPTPSAGENWQRCT